MGSCIKIVMTNMCILPFKPSMMCFLLSPLAVTLGSLVAPKYTLVEMTMSSRGTASSLRAAPKMRSLSPWAYTSALSKKLTPWSRHACIMSLAWGTPSW